VEAAQAAGAWEALAVKVGGVGAVSSGSPVMVAIYGKAVAMGAAVGEAGHNISSVAADGHSMVVGC
jgi:hypothetical protein